MSNNIAVNLHLFDTKNSNNDITFIYWELISCLCDILCHHHLMYAFSCDCTNYHIRKSTIMEVTLYYDITITSQYTIIIDIRLLTYIAFGRKGQELICAVLNLHQKVT